MRIFFIGQKGIPATSGGIERHVEELSKRLAKKNDVFVFCRSYYTKHPDNKFNNVNLIKLPTIKSKHLDTIFHTFLCCLNVLPKKADIIHIHAIGPSLLIPLLKLKRKTKIIVTIHGLDWQRAKWGKLAKWSLKRGEYLATKYADNIVVVSNNLKNYYQETYQRETIHINNGAVIRPRLPLQKMKMYGLEKDNYILTVGRLVPEKGIHYLIKAFNGINSNLKLVIVGDSSNSDSYVNRLKKVALKNKNIIFTGALFDRDLIELYSNSYLYVQPADLEGSPITLLEALSFNNAVLVSDISEHKEIIKNKLGFFFKAGDINSLKVKLKEIIKRSELVKNIRENKFEEYVNKYFSWDKASITVERIYKNNKKNS